MAKPDKTFDAEIETMLRAARSLDPSLEADAFARFWREVAEMDAALAPLAAEEAPLVSEFSPHWPGEQPA